jgi:hypothetical protein
MHKVLVTAVALLFASVASAETARAPQKLTPTELSACRAKGGHAEMVLYYVEACVWPTQDSGKPCRDTADCQGFCEAPLGTKDGAKTLGKCSSKAADRLGGCSNLVERGRSMGDVCVH